MTVSHATALASVPAAIGTLRSHGLRASAARRLVLEALFAADGPVTAEAIASGLDGRVPRSDLASVYRNLETLEAIGVVQHFHPGHGPGRFAPATDGRVELLACERCGDVQAVAPARLDGVRALIEREFGYRARWTHFPMAGECARCSAERGPAAAR
jgi:Fe2+ or Zn2+ uptake regulation protein